VLGGETLKTFLGTLRMPRGTPRPSGTPRPGVPLVQMARSLVVPMTIIWAMVLLGRLR